MAETEKKPAVKKAAVKKKAAAKKSPTAAKKAADQERHDEQVEQFQEQIPEPTEADIAEHKRRENIVRAMEQNEATIESLEQQAQDLRDKNRELLIELYPTSGPSDAFSKSVRGYLKQAAADRTNRALNPARLARMLQDAKLMPIDAAMRANRTRGTKRPNRKAK